tara:strand:- start:226 stop:387 length:162 start_codon:yes stop_codon:yes gene_type:complete
MINWIKNRIKERTSWDGAALIALGLIILLAGPFVKIAAYAAILWGIYTIWKSE